MTAQQILFILTGLIILGAGVCVVTVRKMLHAALWLILALFGIAVLFVILQAPFFGVVQVVVYIGAIAILVIFAVMLTRRVMFDDAPQLNRVTVGAAIVSLALLAAIIFAYTNWPAFQVPLQDVPFEKGQLQYLGYSLVAPDLFLIPFEVSSILLVAALIGAIYIGREKPEPERKDK